MDTSLEKLYTSVYEKLGERMPEEIIGKIVVAVVNALYYLKKELKIIHRDVKPSNILLDRHGSVRLCDFGISGQLIDSIAKTKDVGCRPYMSVSVMQRIVCAHLICAARAPSKRVWLRRPIGRVVIGHHDR
jgi:mitogen-activated protein kinase kinase 4